MGRYWCESAGILKTSLFSAEANWKERGQIARQIENFKFLDIKVKDMKTLNVKNFSQAKAQSGFTIIELVVVILLLGILTATALPRFLDVTDEAHQSVVDATLGGLGTGAALFRAQWVAEGEPITVMTEFPGIVANTASGYPVGATSGIVATSDADCVAIATGLLQAIGRVNFTALGSVSAAGIGTGVAAASVAGVDFVVNHVAASDQCEYWYSAQDGTDATTTRQLLTYDSGDGTLVQTLVSPAS